MVTYSKVFGPTDSVAGTKTTVGAAVSLRPEPCYIYRIRVGKGNVVNAKENAGVIEIEAPGLDGTHKYAYGNGSGGATNNGQNQPAEKIDCGIPIAPNVLVTVSVKDAEAAKDVTVSLEFRTGSGRNIRSYAVGGAAVDSTADAALTVGTMTMELGGTIKQIRFAGSGIVDAKAASGKLMLEVPGLKGPFEYAVGNGPGGASLGGAADADVFDVEIPVGPNVGVIAYLTSAEVVLSATVSIQVA